MKNQYLGDIGDYGKYGLLRFLAIRGIKIGINWYLTEDDESADLATTVMDIVQDKSAASEILSFAGGAKDPCALNTFLTRMYNNDMPMAGEIYRAVKKTIGKPSLAAEVIKLL